MATPHGHGRAVTVRYLTTGDAGHPRSALSLARAKQERHAVHANSHAHGISICRVASVRDTLVTRALFAKAP